METLSHSEEQVMVALWSCGRPAARREIAARLPESCRWADTTLLNFLLRLENKHFVSVQRQGNKNVYTPLVRRETYCGAVSAAHLQRLYGGDARAMLGALADTGASATPPWSAWPATWTPAPPKARSTTMTETALRRPKPGTAGRAASVCKNYSRAGP